MSSARERSARRILERLSGVGDFDVAEPVDPSIPVLVTDDLVVWADGRYVACLPVERPGDVES